MFEYLIDVDSNTGKHIPMLATEWMMSRDAVTLTFTLQEGVEFHSGWGEFTAKDVKHSVAMLIQEDSSQTEARFWREFLDDIEVLDQYTVRFNLTRPEPDIIHRVSAQGGLMMLSKAQWAAEGIAGMEAKPARVHTSTKNVCSGILSGSREWRTIGGAPLIFQSYKYPLLQRTLLG